MHQPTTPERRVAALRYQVERLLHDAATWGYAVAIEADYKPARLAQTVHIIPVPASVPRLVEARITVTADP